MLDEGAGKVTGQTEDKPEKSITYLKPLNHLKTLMTDKNLIVTLSNIANEIYLTRYKHKIHNLQLLKVTIMFSNSQEHCQSCKKQFTD